MEKNRIVWPPDGTCCLEITSEKHGVFLSKIDERMVDYIQERKWGIAYSKQCANGRQYYVRGRVGKEEVFLHQYITVPHPDGKQIDHVHHPLDNRIASLRYVTHQENGWNRPTTKGYELTPSGRYRVRIKHNSTLTHIGYYNTPDEAHAAYLAAKTIYHVIAYDPAISRF